MNSVIKAFLLAFLLIPLSAKVQKLDLVGVVDVDHWQGKAVFLSQHGEVFHEHEGNYVRMEVPDRILQLEVGHDSLYLLREDGSVWQMKQDGLHMIDRDLPVRQMLVYGNRLYLLRNMGALSCIENGRPRMLLTGHQYAVMTRSGNQLYLVDGWGRLYRYDTYVDFLEMIDSAPDTVQVAGADDVLFLLKKNGQVYKYEDMQFFPLQYQKPVTTLETNGRYLYFANRDGEVFELNLAVERMDQLEVTVSPDYLRWIEDRLYISERGGEVYQYIPHPRRHSIQVNFHRLYHPTIKPMRHGYSNSRGF